MKGAKHYVYLLLHIVFLHPDMGVEVPHLIVERTILTPSPELLGKIDDV